MKNDEEANNNEKGNATLKLGIIKQMEAKNNKEIDTIEKVGISI